MDFTIVFALGIIVVVGFFTYIFSQACRRIVNKGFSIAASSLPVVLVLFVFGLIFNLINLKLAPQTQDPNAPPSLPMAISGIVFVLATVYMQAGSMGFVRDKIKQGSASLSNFTGAAAKYYVKILLLSLTIALVIGGYVLLSALAVTVLTQRAEYVAMGLAILIAAIGIYTLILLFFAPYLAICDEKKIKECLSGSVKVVRANILKVVGISVTLVAIGFVTGILLGIVVGLVTRVIPAGVSQYIFAVISSLINAFLGLTVTASFMSFYLGLSSTHSAEAAHS